MKRLLFLGGLLVLSACIAFPQATGFGSAGAAGILFQGGDPAQLTQRIMSSTRYKLTPGDVYLLSITQEPNRVDYPLVLQENYDLRVPNMDSLNVKGMYFADLRALIIARVKKLLPYAQFITLTLQSPARFDVNVFGGVQTPGTVTVNATQRVSDALILAGRLVPGATYRSIALTRGDTKITVDLQRYRLDGTSEANPFLEPGDQIYVPPAGLMVTLSGSVRYPGTFEMVDGETLASLVSYAGGLLPDANGGQIDLARFAADGSTTRRTLAFAKDSATVLVNGDRVRIPSLVENSEMILVTGAVFGGPLSADKPIPVPLVPVAVNIPYVPGLSLLQVLEALGGPTPYANASNATILHKATGQSTNVDVETLWVTKDPAKDILLEPGDTVSIPMVTQVFVAGEVFSPGKLPYDPGLRVGDYLIASGGINPQTGDPNSIWFVDKLGQRTRAGLGSPVTPGAVILVDKNSWAKTQITLANVGVITGFVASIVALLTAIVVLYVDIPK
jgi:polysaccharide export outer membrane protein